MNNHLTYAMPNQAGAVILHQLFRQKVKKSFLLLLQEAARVLNKPYQQQIDFIANLQDQKKFSPQVYYNYYSLLAAMANNQVDQCEKLCADLCNILTEENSYAELFEIQNFKNTAWENIFLNEVLNKNAQGEYQALNENEFATNQKILLQALETINSACIDMYAELTDHLNFIKLVKGNFYIYAASSVKYLGAIPIAPPANSINAHLYYFDNLIHEGAHSHLNILMGLDPIVLNKPDELFMSPARKVPRPMKGIFHAHFVFYRLIYMYRKAHAFFVSDSNTADLNSSEVGIKDLPWDYQIRLTAYIEKFKEGEKIIKDHAKLTEQGLALFNNMSENI